MNEREKSELIDRLERRFAGRTGSGLFGKAERAGRGSAGGGPVHDAFDRLVDAGASRFGLRVEHRKANGFSACDLAPPLARMIDHTALKPETTEDLVRELCREAVRYCFASVCVNPCYVPLAAGLLAGSEVAVCTVVGFPLGATTSGVKAHEAEQAVTGGATEIDMVINVGMLKSGRYEFVEEDIRAVVDMCRTAEQPGATPVISKVILETALLTEEEKVIASVLAQNAGADFVKTSTGFSTGGATIGDVSLMRRVVGSGMGVKASGGVRTRADAEAMIAHGATRIGASASVAIIKELAETN